MIACCTTEVTWANWAGVRASLSDEVALTAWLAAFECPVWLVDNTRSVASLSSAECQKLDFPALRKQLCHPRFASGVQCMTSMTVKNKRMLVLM